ncbi:MAG: hypothetical protein J6S67_12960 [Methanobrevibacter sp.]|nr:hypothetical protein [Methanobrevibacter sp.]
MKREKLITRTIISTKVNAKFFNLADEVVFNSEVTFTGKLDEKDAKKACMETIENNPSCGYTFIKINNLETIEKLYGVTESEFMAIAKELPPRKNNETQEDE